MLAVLLGASEFPKSPQLLESRSFYNSAYDVREYLCDGTGLALPRANVLSLFNDTRSSSDQLEEIAGFLENREQQLKSVGSSPSQLLIYYVGHGLFTRGAEQAYCLAVRNTNENNLGPTSMRAADLADVVKERARHLKRYLVLDCCFAASMYKEFQSGALTAVQVQIKKEFPERGTALMCSSSAYEPSMAPRGLEHTMFTSALIRSLRRGDAEGGPLLTFSELGELVRDYIREEFQGNGVRPEVHSPDQRQGDIANDPLFPNPGYVERQAAKERATTASAGRRVIAEAGGEAPVLKPRRAKQKVETQEPTGDRRSARSEQRQAPQARMRTGSRGEVSTGKAKKIAAPGTAAQRRADEARKQKLARLENEKKVQLAAKRAAEKLLIEWRKSERAKELERKRLAKQRAEEKRARIAAEEERLRKEKVAAQEAAADRELKRLRLERAQAAGTKRPGVPADNRKGGSAPRVSPPNANRVPLISQEARSQQKARRAAPLKTAAALYRRSAVDALPEGVHGGSSVAERKSRQDAAAERELKRMRSERAEAAKQKRAALSVHPANSGRIPAQSKDSRAEERARLTAQDAAAERELERLKRERAAGYPSIRSSRQSWFSKWLNGPR
jgi:hypothetical protein